MGEVSVMHIQSFISASGSSELSEEEQGKAGGHVHTSQTTQTSHCDTNPAVTQENICRPAQIQHGCSESRSAQTDSERNFDFRTNK